MYLFVCLVTRAASISGNHPSPRPVVTPAVAPCFPVSYIKRIADFLTYCLQSNDPALAPPAPTLPGHKYRVEQQRYYFGMYKRLREEYMQNTSMTNAYTSFMEQWQTVPIKIRKASSTRSRLRCAREQAAETAKL
eukprot:COSAG05_NODE_759_length_7489_cov_110.169959_3_plen_135_part_00